MGTTHDLVAVNAFRQILGMTESDTIPAELMDMFRTYRKRRDIVGGGDMMAPEYLILATIYESKHGSASPVKPKKNAPFEKGAKVTSLFGGVKVEGEFLKMLPEPGLCAVAIPGDTVAYRKLKLEDTALAEK